LAERDEEIDQTDKLRMDIRKNLKEENEVQRQKVLVEKRRLEQENVDFVQDENMMGREQNSFSSRADIAT